MKLCSQCNRTYPDDSLKFCLSDGTPLVSAFETLEEMTVIRAQPYINAPIAPAHQGVNHAFAYLAVGAFMLLIGGAIFMWMRSGSSVSSNDKKEATSATSNSVETKPDEQQERLNAQKANLREEQAQLEKEKQRLADERKKIEAQKNKLVETATLNQTISAVQPTERVKFRRGSVEETISGRIGIKRDYVLRTMNGQYLSATVNSRSGGCVVFDNGSTNTSYTTISGDSYLSLVNNCRADTNFSLTIYVR